MASHQLSAKQFAALALGRQTGPWRLADTLKAYGKSAMSIGSAIATLSNTPVVLFVSSRSQTLTDGTISAAQALADGAYEGASLGWYMTGVTNPSPWQMIWSPAGAEPQDLSALTSILGPYGVSVVYLDDSDTVGICATVGQLANIPTSLIPYDPTHWAPDQVSLLSGAKVDGAYAVNGVFLIQAPSANGGAPANMAYVNPIAPPSVTGQVQVGLLALWLGQDDTSVAPAGVDAAILAANHLEMSALTIQRMLDRSISKLVNTTSDAALSGILDTINDYIAWIDYLAVVKVSNPPASVTASFSGDFTVPAITLQPADKSQAQFSLPAYASSGND